MIQLSFLFKSGVTLTRPVNDNEYQSIVKDWISYRNLRGKPEINTVTCSRYEWAVCFEDVSAIYISEGISRSEKIAEAHVEALKAFAAAAKSGEDWKE